EPALLHQVDARGIPLEKNPEQHVLPNPRRVTNRVLNEGGANTTAARVGSNVVRDFSRATKGRPARAMRAERAPADHRPFTLRDVKGQRLRIVLVEPG